MTIETLSAWVLSIMLATIPPGKPRWPKEARESSEAGRARYAQIARTIAEVSMDEDETPIFSGPHARGKTAALLLTISFHESHWARHIDLGLGPLSRRGGGVYHCMMQIAVFKKKTPEGWTAKDLVKDRDKCFRRGLHILQRARRYCMSKKYGPRSMLNLYASGHCDHAHRPVNKRWRTYDAWLAKYPLAKAAKKKPSKKKAPKKKKPRREAEARRPSPHREEG